MSESRFRVGYFTHTPIRISETFLDKMLESLSRSFSVTFYCGENQSERSYPCDVEFLGFDESRIEARWGSFIARVRRRLTSSRFRINTQEKTFESRFRRIANSTGSELDFAFIEYGTSAVVVAPFLARSGIPYAVNFHGYDASERLGDPVYRERLKFVLQNARFIVVPSHHLRRRIMLLGMNNLDCHVIPYSPKYEELPRPSYPQNPVVVSLGRLTEKKCPEALVMTAFLVLKENPNVKFKIVGGGFLNDSTQGLIDELGLSEAVELVGACPHDVGLGIIASASLFIQHSVTSPTGDQEGFPVALAEAAALGKAIVSTYHSGISENVVHGETGYLVQEHNFEKMAGYVLELLALPSRAKAMGELGKARIKELAPPGYRERFVIDLIKEEVCRTKSGC